MPISTINPATGETLKVFEALTESEVEAKLELAESAFAEHRRRSFEQKAAWLMRAAEILEAGRDKYGRLMTLEMGKPLKAAMAEAEKCAWVCRYYAENAERFLADEPVQTEAAASYIRYQPLGPVLAIMPWNFPFWQVWRFAAPALMAGNVGLLKHASNVPQSALAIEEILLEAGFPVGVFQTLLVPASGVPRLLEDRRVRAVTLTGSTPAGSQVASLAGKLIKKSVLELGGSDAFIVMPSADLATAASTAVRARTINNGQSCIAAKRFIVHADVADEFERRFVAGMEALIIGDPMQLETEIGPLSTQATLEEVVGQVDRSVALGARILTGGHKLGGPGFYYPPTLLTDIPPGAPVACEEVFGPVGMLYRVGSLAAALELANATPFGLGACIWTNDRDEQMRAVEALEAGTVFVNGMVASDPRLPFGGVKESGYGRELSEIGIREFVNIKTVVVQAAPRRR
jgi:succinate-semialdehyde dehydrogenase/glutarate-semialdehyde dehydrogenase